MAELAVDVTLRRGGFALEVREKLELAGITALFGPSGSGKTTLLRIVSGLEHGAQGTVEFDGEAWQTPRLRVPAHRRSVGYVFQDGRLFPHLDVERNLSFGMGRGAADGGSRRGMPNAAGMQRDTPDAAGTRRSAPDLTAGTRHDTPDAASMRQDTPDAAGMRQDTPDAAGTRPGALDVAIRHDTPGSDDMRRGGAGDGTQIRFNDVVDALDLAPLLARRPASLSGGEQQRVAIGRALLSNPRLLLMDEPMSSLDVRRKAEILPYIERLPAAFGLPVLYVTHSVDEVARLASNVVLLAGGRIVGRGPVADILERIDLWPVTGRLDAGILLEARVEQSRAGIASLALGTQRLHVPLGDVPPGATVRLRIHARDVAVAVEKPRRISIRNVLAARILSIDLDGPVHVELLLDVDGRHLRSRITRDALDELELEAGQNVYALIKSVVLEDRRLGDAAG